MFDRKLVLNCTELGAAGIASRFGYQGEYAEKDGETGWNNFYLRNYDPAIGRWLSVDPYGQYYSPYVGMGNDPINRFDPDGGWADDGGGIWGWFKNLISYPKGHENNPIAIDVVTVTAFKPNNGTIKPFTPNFMQSWHDNNNSFAKLFYNIIDAPYVYATGFGNINNARHLSGYGADPNEYRNAGIETISSLVPISRAGGLKLFKPIAAKTGGRLGNAATRSQTQKIAVELKSRGYTIEGGGMEAAEEFLKPLGGGRKGGSYLDITAKHPNYPTLRINTVDVLKDGVTPTARELRNAARIRTQIGPGEHLLLIPKR